MITLTREEAQKVLDLISRYRKETPLGHQPHMIAHKADEAIETLRAKLSEPKPDPVAYLWECLGRWSAMLANDGEHADLSPPLWLCDAIEAATTPPQRKICQRCGEVNPAEIHTCTPQREWVGMTDMEIVGIATLNQGSDFSFARAIEAKLKEKNG